MSISLVTRRENSLKSDAEIENQVRLHVIVRLAAAGVADCSRIKSNRICKTIVNGVAADCREHHSWPGVGIRHRNSRSRVHAMHMRRDFGNLEGVARFAASLALNVEVAADV